jgi:hypothetical protein
VFSYGALGEHDLRHVRQESNGGAMLL